MKMANICFRRCCHCNGSFI